MTTSFRILSVFLVLTIFSCSKLSELSQFDIDYDTEVIIPSSSLTNTPFDIPTIDIENNFESLFKKNNTNKDLIEYINLKQFKLVLKSPDKGSLNFLKSINVYISADSLKEKKIAWKENIPETTENELALDVSTDDLKAYLITDSYKLRFNTTTDKAITKDHVINLDTKFFVDAKILGF